MVTLALASVIAGGCADDGGGEADGADADALAWLPADTWLVATGDLSAERIDAAVATLDRLPIWALAEGFLPASDGEGLRRALLQQVAGDVSDHGEDGGAGEGPTARELEAAFGDGAGFAIFEADFAAIDGGEDMPFLAWVEVDDEERATAVVRELFDGDEREQEHQGRTFWENREDEATWTVQDGLLLVTTTPGRMQALIDVREGDDSLGAEDAGTAVRAATDDAVASLRIQSDPLLDAAPELARQAVAGRAAPAEADVDDAVERLGEALGAESVRELVPDWVGGSITVDDVGLRMRAVWSNPRELPEAEPGARELVERMPAGIASASGMASRGDDLQRLQAAWADARDEADLDLRDAIDCPQQQAWACELAVEALLTVLEDEQLAEAVAEQGDTAAVLVQDLGPALQAALAASTRRGAAPAAAPPRLRERVVELVAPSTEPLGWQADAELADAMEEAGVTVEHGDGAVVLRVAAGSPTGIALRRSLDPESRATLAMLGIDATALLTERGLRLAPEQVDGLELLGLPLDADSIVADELRSGDDALGGDDDYEAVVAAAGAPEATGSWAWVDLAGIVQGALEAASAESPEVRRALPTVRNNLADVPGAISWTTIEDAEGEDVGVAELVLPILE